MLPVAVRSFASPGFRWPLKIVLPSATRFTSAARVACNFKARIGTARLPAEAAGRGEAAETMAESEFAGTVSNARGGTEESSCFAVETVADRLCMYSVTRGTKY